MATYASYDRQMIWRTLNGYLISLMNPSPHTLNLTPGNGDGDDDDNGGRQPKTMQVRSDDLVGCTITMVTGAFAEVEVVSEA
ncbi:hypothetical protein LguiA_002756 [Lonicera macranthoides]